MKFPPYRVRNRAQRADKYERRGTSLPACFRNLGNSGCKPIDGPSEPYQKLLGIIDGSTCSQTDAPPENSAPSHLGREKKHRAQFLPRRRRRNPLMRLRKGSERGPVAFRSRAVHSGLDRIVGSPVLGSCLRARRTRQLLARLDFPRKTPREKHATSRSRDIGSWRNRVCETRALAWRVQRARTSRRIRAITSEEKHVYALTTRAPTTIRRHVVDVTATPESPPPSSTSRSARTSSGLREPSAESLFLSGNVSRDPESRVHGEGKKARAHGWTLRVM